MYQQRRQNQKQHIAELKQNCISKLLKPLQSTYSVYKFSNHWREGVVFLTPINRGAPWLKCFPHFSFECLKHCSNYLKRINLYCNNSNYHQLQQTTFILQNQLVMSYTHTYTQPNIYLNRSQQLQYNNVSLLDNKYYKLLLYALQNVLR